MSLSDPGSGRPAQLLFTCEHAGNDVPEEFSPLFAGHRELLESHRGIDIGAADLARYLGDYFDAPVETAPVTRLIVDQNRSIHNRRSLFSSFTRKLSRAERAAILDQYYWPYQDVVRQQVEAGVRREGRVIHLSVHSFTPELNGRVRCCDISLMYDPTRHREVEFCRQWKRHINSGWPDMRLRRNYPYRGVDDGIVPALRRSYPASEYVGLQLEINQAFPQQGGEAWQRLKRMVARTFAAVLLLPGGE